MIKEIVMKNRSYRRFIENKKIDSHILTELIELARYTPSSVNFQPMRFKVINDAENNFKVFETLSWAGLLKDWKGPEEGERPSAYIIILTDLSVAKNMKIDVGIVAQTIMLGAAEKGFGGCMLGSIRREKLAESLGIDPEKYSIDLVLALGDPAEEVRIVDLPESGATAYYRDENDVHCVPKRKLGDLII
ncbi:MAG: nitroreductase family protein [Acutalibacteraceae bacterium]|nr:nitroreductase family protein [Acutalibacteraceae bacterium]